MANVCECSRLLRPFPIGAAVSLALIFFNSLTYSQVTELPPISSVEKHQTKSARNGEKPLHPNLLIKSKLDPEYETNFGNAVHTNDLTASDRTLIEKACRLKQYSGPAAYHECQNAQAVEARNSRPVSFIGVSVSDRALIEKACRLKQYSGPAAYHQCQRDQISQLQTVHSSNSARTK